MSSFHQLFWSISDELPKGSSELGVEIRRPHEAHVCSFCLAHMSHRTRLIDVFHDNVFALSFFCGPCCVSGFSWTLLRLSESYCNGSIWKRRLCVHILVEEGWWTNDVPRTEKRRKVQCSARGQPPQTYDETAWLSTHSNCRRTTGVGSSSKVDGHLRKCDVKSWHIRFGVAGDVLLTPCWKPLRCREQRLHDQTEHYSADTLHFWTGITWWTWSAMSESLPLEPVVSLLNMNNQESCGKQKFPSRALFYDQWVQLVPKFLSTWSHLRTWTCRKTEEPEVSPGPHLAVLVSVLAAPVRWS